MFFYLTRTIPVAIIIRLMEEYTFSLIEGAI